MTETTIDYQSPQTQRPITRWWFRIALLCALLPMFVGTVTILLYLATYARVFISIGTFTLVGGILLFVVGCVSLLVRGVLIATRREGKREWSTLFVLLLLVANFPLAFTYMELGQCWRVTVVNQTTSPITAFTFSLPDGRKVSVPTIAPGGNRDDFWLNPKGEGAIAFTATAGTTPVSGTVSGYVTSRTPGEYKTVTFHADGTVTIQ